jgi:hypothetical protein
LTAVLPDAAFPRPPCTSCVIAAGLSITIEQNRAGASHRRTGAE